MKEERVKKLQWRYVIIIAVMATVILIQSYPHILGVKQLADEINPFDCESQYSFINTNVACGSPPVISKIGYAETQDEIRKLIDSKIANGDILEAGVYFRDLENGPVFGVNENLDFSAASLLKLPLALAYYSVAVEDPNLLDRTLSFKNSLVTAAQHYPASKSIQPNTDYTIREIIRRMLVYSDNNAYALLIDFMNQTGNSNLLQETYVDLGLATPDTAFDETMTVRRYGSIFRALYNVSYLDAEHDEEILEWLVESDFTQGLESGLPDGVMVANKFGERVDEDGKFKQLHDCGIVYYPGNPYLLCVMSRGPEFEKSAGVIAEISKIIYQEVDSRKLR